MMNINPQGWVANRDQRPNAGIDVSKQHLDACWGAQELRVDNDATGWDELIAKLKDAGVDLVVIEATGGYERELVCALQSAHQLPLVAAGGFDHHQVDAGVLELRDQLVPPSRVVVDTQLLRTPASIQMLLGNVDAGVRTLIAIRYPALRIDVHHWQLFGLHGWTERADALTKCSIASWRLRGVSGLAHRPRNSPQHQAVDKWTARAALEPAGLPWTTLRVAHRASLCPLDHSLQLRLSKYLQSKSQKTQIRRYKGLGHARRSMVRSRKNLATRRCERTSTISLN